MGEDAEEVGNMCEELMKQGLQIPPAPFPLGERMVLEFEPLLPSEIQFKPCCILLPISVDVIFLHALF